MITSSDSPHPAPRGSPSARPWITSLLLALPIVFWPAFEALFGFGNHAVFLPFLTQVDVALPLSWMVRLADDPAVGDLVLWEHRHGTGSPMSLCLWWPMLYSELIRFAGGPPAYWAIVWALHAVWIRAAAGVAEELLGGGRRAWPVATAFVYLSLPLAINLYHAKWHAGLWGVLPIYENYRGFPSVTALTGTTLAVWRTLVALRLGRRDSFLAAGLWTSLTVYGRPFDWMILVTFLGLMFLLSLVLQWGRDGAAARFSIGPANGWGFALGGAILGALPFLARYALWSRGSTEVYAAQLARGVMEAKAPLHFFKYALLGVGFTAGVGAVLGLFPRRFGNRPLASPAIRAFWVLLVGASFLPYFQFLPSGKTPTAFQYFFIYFSVPFAWMGILCAAAALPDSRRPASSPGARLLPLALALGVGLASQLALLGTPRWMFERVAFDRAQQPLYDALRKAGPDAVVLCPSITQGSGQELILRAGAWAYVPHPMMYSFGSLATNAELVERQLLAKLVLTGTVADLAPLFAEGGLPDYPDFYARASPETRHWLDRLENCPARASFFFDPQGSREDLRVRGLSVPPSLLSQSATFAWFSPEERNAWRRIHELENLPPEVRLREVGRRYRLTHILLLTETLRYSAILAPAPAFRRVATTPGGALWAFAPLKPQGSRR